MSRLRRLVPASALSVLILIVTVPSASRAVPAELRAHAFGPGERLTFAIRYLGLRAGTAVMDIQLGEPVNGRPTWRLRTVARSEGAVALVFPVEDRVESLVDAETLLPYDMAFHKHEGRKTTRSHVVFDHTAGTAITTAVDGTTTTAAIPPGTQHAFSALYALRDRPSVRLGDAVQLNVHHERKNYPLTARVEQHDIVRGAWGSRDALEVLVQMPFRGIWLNEGFMRVWVTADHRHVPLRITAKIILGSIVADLIEETPSGPRADASMSRGFMERLPNTL